MLYDAAMTWWNQIIIYIYNYIYIQMTIYIWAWFHISVRLKYFCAKAGVIDPSKFKNI